MAPPCAMVIFGAAGDLTKRLVVPALYNLVNDRQLSDGFQLVGVDLASKTADEWRKGLTETMKSFIGRRRRVPDQPSLIRRRGDGSADRMSYVQGDLNDPEPTGGWANTWRSWRRPPTPRATTSFTSPSRIVSLPKRSLVSALRAW